MAYEMETIYRIFSNDGFFYEVGNDPAGLGNDVEVRYYEDVDDKVPKQSIALTEESLPLLIEALQKMHAQKRG